MSCGRFIQFFQKRRISRLSIAGEGNELLGTLFKYGLKNDAANGSYADPAGKKNRWNLGVVVQH